jgi:hypothetical protein
VYLLATKMTNYDHRNRLSRMATRHGTGLYYRTYYRGTYHWQQSQKEEKSPIKNVAAEV